MNKVLRDSIKKGDLITIKELCPNLEKLKELALEDRYDSPLILSVRYKQL
jgi:hypothetical protein